MLRPFAIVPCLVIVAVASLAPAQTQPQDLGSAPTPAAIVTFHGEVNAFTQDVFIRQFNQARALGAKTVVIDLDTYGGGVKSALELSHFLKQQSDLRTIAYVNNKAYSAGSMIAIACNEIIMAPAAAIGDCAPISIGSGGLQPLPPAERAKTESPILADFQDSADRNGYDPLLVQSMVSVNRAVYWIEKDGQRRFVGPNDYEQLTKAGWEPVEGVPNPVDGPDTLLTAYTDLAIKLGLAKGSASTIDDLLRQRNLTAIATFKPGVGSDIVGFLNNDLVRGALLIIFLTSLYAALHAPGHGFPEA
ncbi:MAG: hypothetical protein ACM359_12890, partial [Bacillota bacterium]